MATGAVRLTTVNDGVWRVTAGRTGGGDKPGGGRRWSGLFII